MTKKSLKDLDIVKGSKVIIRVDFNVPLEGPSENPTVLDDTRIKASLPTIQYVIDKGAKVILISHMGRPKGIEAKYSLKPIVSVLGSLLHKEVKLIENILDSSAKESIDLMQDGDVVLLENIRFFPAEEKPELDKSFASKLAEFGEFFIQEAFATAHRKHSSTYFLPEIFKEKVAAGFLVEKEIVFFDKLLKTAEKPFYAVIGGSKISSKITIIKSLLKKVDALLIGGAMAFTFLKAKGISVGNSLVEDDQLELAKSLLEDSTPIILPADFVIAQKCEATAETTITNTAEGIKEGFAAYDIGPATVELFNTYFQKAKLVFWNGPMGVYEIAQFAKGTQLLVDVLAKSNATTIIGGGDVVAAIESSGLSDKMSHISTGGGASLEYIEQGSLPCIDILADK